jgi:hypothetical protein
MSTPVASWVGFILRPTVSRPVRLGIGLPFGAHDQVLSLSFLKLQLLCSSCRAPSLTWGRDCNLQCNRWLLRSLRTNNHTLPSHLRLCSLFVTSYDSQGLRWRYSNPPPHGVCGHGCTSNALLWNCCRHKCSMEISLRSSDNRVCLVWGPLVSIYVRMVYANST